MQHLFHTDRKMIFNNTSEGFFSLAMLELTDRCNFKCLHCYNDASYNQRNVSMIKETIAYLKELGVVYVILTGGEALIYPDFEEIYLHLKKNGFLVTIYTNGSHIIDYTALWEEYPPFCFSVSIYGINSDMYNSFTNTKRQFERVVCGLETAFQLGIPLELKAIVTKNNFDAVMSGAYDRFAERFGTRIKYGYALFETEAGNDSIHKLQLDSSQLYAIAQIPENFHIRQKYMECLRHNPCYRECKAGRKTLAVNSAGDFCVCIRDTSNGYQEKGMTVGKIREYLRRRKDAIVEINRLQKCVTCNANEICSGDCILEGETQGSEVCKFHRTMMEKAKGSTWI